MGLLRHIIELARGNDRFITGPYARRDGWTGGEGRIIFCNRPDPLNMSRRERGKEMLKQIREDVTRGNS
jgi:hypothetical protein